MQGSTLVAALGFMLSCYLDAKAGRDVQGSGFKAEATYFILSVHLREWTKLPILAEYFVPCLRRTSPWA
jgi:hypothetical protein